MYEGHTVPTYLGHEGTTTTGYVQRLGADGRTVKVQEELVIFFFLLVFRWVFFFYFSLYSHQERMGTRRDETSVCVYLVILNGSGKSV